METVVEVAVSEEQSSAGTSKSLVLEPTEMENKFKNLAKMLICCRSDPKISLLAFLRSYW